MIQAFIGPLTNLAGTWLNNRAQKAQIKQRIQVAKLEAKGKPILVMGKSFKPETNITTGSPSIYLYNSLKKRRSKIFIWDPEVDQLSLEKFLYNQSKQAKK